MSGTQLQTRFEGEVLRKLNAIDAKQDAQAEAIATLRVEVAKLQTSMSDRRGSCPWQGDIRLAGENGRRIDGIEKDVADIAKSEGGKAGGKTGGIAVAIGTVFAIIAKAAGWI